MIKEGVTTGMLMCGLMLVGPASAFQERGGGAPADMIERHDQDGDGFISRNEDRQGPRPEGAAGRVPGGFERDDVDGDGVVSREEFSGPSDHFDRIDRNGDGYIQESEARQGPPGLSRADQEKRTNDSDQNSVRSDQQRRRR